MANENIFRFLALRPTQHAPQPQATTPTPLYQNDQENSSELIASLVQAQESGLSSREIKARAGIFKNSPGYVLSAVELLPGLGAFSAFCRDRLGEFLVIQNLDNAIENAFGTTATALVATPAFQSAWQKLSDSILADSLYKDEDSERLSDELVYFWKLLWLVQSQSNNTVEAPETSTLGQYLQRIQLIIPEKMRIRKEMPPLPHVDTPAPKDPQPGLKQRMRDLLSAHRELSIAAKNSSMRYIPKVKPVDPTPPTDNPDRSLTGAGFNAGLLNAVQYAPALSEMLLQNTNAVLYELGANSAAMPKGGAQFLISKRGQSGLQGNTKEVSRSLNMNLNQLSPIKAVSRIEQEMTFLSAQISSGQAHTEMIKVAGGYVSKSAFQSATGLYKDNIYPLWEILSRCRFEAGVGDLLIVRQKLKAYELGDFAHVENVLAGEIREREHRRLNIREEINISEEEREVEKERDLQSTERNEMQTEAEKVLKEQVGLEAGLKVSGSYGPVVSFEASVNGSFNRQSEETQRKTTAYSREVTEKSSERVRERVRDERRRRTLEEVEEINKHAIDNSNAANGHVRGIYRWLNKIYDAQVFNYGQRMMYEFVIPEPAAYFLYTMVENPPSQTTLLKPEAPTYESMPLRPEHLDRANYQEYVALYHVSNVPAPPSEFKVVSFFEKQDGKEANNFGRATKLSIPDGYEAYSAMVSSHKSFIKDKEKGLKIMIGGVDIDRDDYWGSELVDLQEYYRSEIAISVSTFNVCSFVATVDIFCSLTTEEYTKWQQRVFDAIQQAYQVQKAIYDEKLAAEEIQKGIQILGRNPLENRRLERDELKKLVVMMLNNSPYLALNGYENWSSEPVLNLERSCHQGSFIRFFENAFEWNNMTYVFYPYFWGRKAKWVNALHLTDPDPDFAAFLKAGAARVQVPVRPGFEKAIAHFCQFGEIWEGNDVPLRSDNLYLPIITEISENLGKLDEGVPYPPDSEPWEVTVPTALVLLQDMDEVSGIRDALTGENVDLNNEA